MKDLTVIVPIHELTPDNENYLTRAINSFKTAATDNDIELLFIGPKTVVSKLKKEYGEKNIKYVENGITDFCTQINTAVDHCKKYFSILELDDAYTPQWFKNVEKYSKDDISIYLPLTEIVFDDNLSSSVGYVNEAVWATSFSDELGYMDIDSLLSYMNFNATGGVFKTEDFIKVGKLKASMKLTYWYEFLLRALNNGKKIFVVPKVGYHHTLNRKGSISDEYNKNLSPDEADWWIELAQKEYLFINDRNKQYSE